MTLLSGIHHVTALAKSPQENHAFYLGLLGQRLVKKTVNFDDPLTYHLYYGDTVGTPGTLLTHFPHPMAKRGVHGSPEIRETILSVPEGSIAYWLARLGAAGVPCTTETALGRLRVGFDDPDGMRLALAERPAPGRAMAYEDSDVPPEQAIFGLDSAVIHVPEPERTIEFLEQALGFNRSDTQNDRHEVQLGSGGPGKRLEIVQTPESARTHMGAGIVHHIAWRVPDEGTQSLVAESIRKAGVGVTPVMDRQYFKSIYFRIPGGVIFEIATDGPGFDIDEPMDKLGQTLCLPPQYEPRRAEISNHLRPLESGAAHA